MSKPKRNLEPVMPPMKASEESTEEQLKLAKKQGEAYAGALKAMDEESGADKVRVGEYLVAIVVEEAEGMWHLENGELAWHEPGDENAHIEVAVCDAADGRFIPGLDVTVSVKGSDGKDYGTHQQEMLWHPWLYHYGRNWVVGDKGEYTIGVTIDPPAFMRHDHENGKRYAEKVELEFTREIEPGQKIATEK